MFCAMPSKHLLMVAPFFAPQTHAAVFRAHKLAKYLPEHGWRITVVTVDHAYHHRTDAKLLDDFAERPVRILRPNYVEPTLRGLRMAFGGQDRSYATQHSHGESTNSNSRSTKHLRWPRRAYRQATRALAMPDAYWPWVRPALHAAAEAHAATPFDAIYTSASPHSVLRIGHELQQRLARPWLCDFRDPLGYAARMNPSTAAAAPFQRRLVKQALNHADAVTGTARAYGCIFDDLFRTDMRRPYTFIPTGLDEALLPATETPQPTENTLVFGGEWLKDYGARFLEAFARARRDSATAMHTQLKVVGYSDINRKRLEPQLARYGLSDAVIFVDHLPQQDYYAHLGRARAGLLCPGRHGHWWTNFAKMVDFIALNKAVIFDGPSLSEAAHELRLAGLYHPLTDDTTANAALLAALLERSVTSVGDNDYRERYLASRMTHDFHQLLEEITEA